MTIKLNQLKSCVFIFGIFLTMNLSAQNILETANMQYDLNAYELALENYQSILKEDPSCMICQLNMAETYRKLNKPELAKESYEKVMLKGALKDVYLLGYGHALKALGLYVDAKNIYLEYGQYYPTIGEYFARSCDVALSLELETLSYKEEEFHFNSIMSDKALANFQGSLIYTSFSDKTIYRHSSDWLKKDGELSILKDSETTDQLTVLSNSITDVNAISYSEDNSICAISKTLNSTQVFPVFPEEDGKSLYISNYVNDNGLFKEEKAFPFNETGSSSTHPSLNSNGSILYFSSNRAGGFGGFDIYRSVYKDGQWTTPVNLGDVVNTPGNEITPAIANNGTLYFASDYQLGLGGYDVFTTQVVMGYWTSPMNLGSVVNSSRDDYMPVLNQKGELNYLSSNRLGTNGNIDILAFSNVEIIKEEPLVLESSIPAVFEKVEMEEIDLNIEPIFVMSDESEFEIRELSIDHVMTESSNRLIKDLELLEMPMAFVIPKFKSSALDIDVNLRSVSLNSPKKELLIPANAFFIQIASISNVKANLATYKKAAKLGNVYKIFKNNLLKIRVGYYGDRNEADRVLSALRRKGFKDAFITHDNLNMGEIELIYSNMDFNYSEPSEDISYVTHEASTSVNSSNYKVRLAAYDNPLYFDVAAVKGIAKLEQWSKGDWTIFLLGGFESLQAAESAKIKAINRGFVDAYIVVDNGGILEKLVKN